MLHEKYLIYWKEKWQEAMAKSEQFSLEVRTEQEKSKVWDKIARTYDDAMGADTRRVDTAINELIQKQHITRDSIVLDVGSGTGAYSLPLAKLCKQVYCLDNSSGMGEIVKNKASRQGIENLEFIQEDWRQLDLKARGMYKEFDLVISSLNPGISDYETLVKMHDASRHSCCYIAAAGLGTNNVAAELNSLVFGRELQKGAGTDIIHAFNIIYALGYFPELTYEDCEWTKSENLNETVERFCNHYWRYMEITEDIKSVIRKFVAERLDENEIFTENFKSKLGIMMWTV